MLALLALLACKDDPGNDSGESAAPPALDWTPVLEESDYGAFLSVWGSDADDVWIVGGQETEGVVLRGSEDSWTPMELPAGTPLLNWVHGTSATDVWVGGLFGTLLHWDGVDWTDETQAMDEAIWGLYAADDGTVMAVGGASKWGGELGFALVRDQGSWTSVPLPEEIGDVANLFKVHPDGEQWWIVGASGTALRGTGTSFEAVPTGFAMDIVTANRSPGLDPLMAVGGRNTGSIFVADATSISVVAQAPSGLNGVQVYPSGLAVVAGERGYTGLYDPETGELSDVDAFTSDVLHATWGLPGGQMYAVGGNLFTSDPEFHGFVMRGPAPE